MAKVRKFDTGVTGVGDAKPAPHENIVPDIPTEVADRLAATAPVKIAQNPILSAAPGNPRQRRYRLKTYSLLQQDIDMIESLVVEIRQGGLYDRGRSDIVRAGVQLLHKLSLQEKIKAVDAVESLKN